MKKKLTTRSIEFIAFFQIEAVCRHLRSLVLNGIEPGPETRSVLKSLRDELVGRTTGSTSARIPAVTDQTVPADLLTIAELILATNIAFLSPEELADRNRMGFRPA